MREEKYILTLYLPDDYPQMTKTEIFGKLMKSTSKLYKEAIDISITDLSIQSKINEHLGGD